MLVPEHIIYTASYHCQSCKPYVASLPSLTPQFTSIPCTKLELHHDLDAGHDHLASGGTFCCVQLPRSSTQSIPKQCKRGHPYKYTSTYLTATDSAEGQLDTDSTIHLLHLPHLSSKHPMAAVHREQIPWLHLRLLREAVVRPSEYSQEGHT